MFLPLVQVKSVFLAGFSALEELVWTCVPAGNLVLSQQGNNKCRNRKAAKVGLERTYNTAWPRETQAFRSFCLLYFCAVWPDVGSSEARCCFLDPSEFWLVGRGIRVKLGLFDNGICWRPKRWMRCQQNRLLCFFLLDLLNLWTMTYYFREVGKFQIMLISSLSPALNSKADLISITAVFGCTFKWHKLNCIVPFGTAVLAQVS